MTTIRFLGTGTSIGVPEIGCKCEVCQSKDPHDKRLRTSVLIENEDTRLLLDCGPDFRQQILPLPFKKIDGVLISHVHYDHVSGLDDLRSFCQFGHVNLYAQPAVCKTIKEHMDYAFSENAYPGAPKLVLHPIDEHHFYINSMRISPIQVYHGTLPIYGYRINNLAYLTDMSALPERQIKRLQNLDVLIIDALRDRPHRTHATTEQALETIKKLNPKKSYLIHMCHQFGLHEEVQKRLPENVYIAYDTLEIKL